MKYIFTLLIVLNTASCFGQAFLTDTKKWNDMYAFYATCNCSMHETHSYYIDGDSVINELSYKILFDSTFRATSYSNVNIEVIKKGFVRESTNGNAVFYIENESTDEHKIYDFEFNVGSYLTIGTDSYRVNSTDSIDVLGVKRKVLYLSSDGKNDLFWISGVGSNRGLFYFQYQNALLLCVNENNALIYKNDENYDCVYYDFSSSINETKTSQIELYPNPTSGKFVIKSKKSIESVLVFNSIGKLVISESPNLTEFSVDLTKYVKGLYFVQIDNEVFKLIME